jgi:hypothetical protein
LLTLEAKDEKFKKGIILEKNLIFEENRGKCNKVKP